jgi:flagellar motor protein MotB
MPRGHYTYDTANKLNADATGAPKVSMNRYEALLELYEAQNATAIARAASAEQYAPQTFAKAQELLSNAQRLESGKAASSLVVQLAREAAQTAEDARTIAEKRRQEEQVASLQAEAAKAQLGRAQAEGEAYRLRTEVDSARADADRERSARERAEADAASARQQATVATVAVPSVIVTPPAPAATAQPQGEAQKELRMRLLEQLNGVLSTRDTPRGLVATVLDSSFSGTELKEPVSSGIGRVAAILQQYPELRVVVEGYSDSATTESQAGKRAESVRQMLDGHGLPAGRSTVRGLGNSRPLVSNSTSTGREQNRRVEIVISGDPIGALAYWDRTYSLMPNR